MSQKLDKVVEQAGPQRLLPRIIDFNAECHPTKLYALFPKSDSFTDGYCEFTYKQFAESINCVSRWLDDMLRKGQEFETFAYIGSKDVRYSILAVAAIKTGRKVHTRAIIGDYGNH